MMTTFLMSLPNLLKSCEIHNDVIQNDVVYHDHIIYTCIHTLVIHSIYGKPQNLIKITQKPHEYYKRHFDAPIMNILLVGKHSSPH